MEQQQSSTAAQPQGDGDPRPFRTSGDGPVRVHSEKRGPAFSEAAVVSRLIQTIQSQAIKAVGETLNALQRRSLLDLCAAWPRLLKVAGVVSLGARSHARDGWQWGDMEDAVKLALCYAEQPHSLKWQEADALIRGYAFTAALATESRMAVYEVECEPAHLETIKRNAATYRAFAEGRS